MRIFHPKKLFSLTIIGLVFTTILLFLSCEKSKKAMSQAEFKKLQQELSDKKANRQTVALFHHLKTLADSGKTLFGQQDYTANNRGWDNMDELSNVKAITGSHPALNSLDFYLITNPNKDTARGRRILNKLTQRTYKEGGVVSFCWHYYNPKTGKNFYDTTKVAKELLPKGALHHKFKHSLQQIASFAKNVKDEEGNLIPIIFRPWHEFDGNWFWWGQNFVSQKDFKELFQFTVTYLRDTLKVNNFLYAFSPDRNFHSEEEYLKRYPGDEFIDVVGMDNYWDFTPEGEGIDSIIKKIQIISAYAKKKNKIAALTEGGVANVPDSLWFTTKLLKVINAPNVNLSYVALWRGEYVPNPKHPAAKDFNNFYQEKNILFQDDLPNLYQFKK
ncbi:glycoside hydrolase family 26 protein [Mesonia aestuariivivens]|uniref:Glycoside hydrolase family 26 protein n=1 Tax=Mesonia aestuariivivens TaxID=2796128 RepID=A0ABS6W4D6_9FLAO|nr:glycosyl hydrolase [Mesonia aestuariivivens]MBW2962727.1 glycoside hydrolase family 26 protein [Mesonia aestuariivivens]